MKKGLFFLFALFMFTPHIQGAVSTGTCGANLTWSLDYSTKTLTISGSGNMYSWSKVAGTYAPWYQSRGSIEKVILPQDLTSIGGRAFYDCSHIHSITIPQNVVKIGGDAFTDSAIDTVTWDAYNYPSPLSYNNPFYDIRSQIKDFTFGNSIDTVPSYLCNGMNNLISVTLGSNVKVIEKSSFSGCSKLSSIINNSNILTEIGQFAFSGCSSLSSVTIPLGVSVIEESTFSSCTALSQIELHNGIRSIRSNAFNGCASLSSIIIPESVDSIYKQAFYACAFSSLTIPQSVSYIDESAIDKCISLSSIVWESPCQPTCIHLSRKNKSFNIRDSIVSFVLGNSMTTIPDSLFRGMKNLTTVSLPNSVTLIDNNAFIDCKTLATINIPNEVTTIGDRAFANCYALSAITIPQKVTSIGQSAFSACKALSQVSIPNSVTSIGWGAFQSCSALQTANIGNNAAIGDAAFESCTSLTNVILGSSVPSIGASAFKNCTNLAAINIPNSVRKIGTYAFADCISLTSNISLPNGLKKVEYATFKNCASLQTVVFPNSIDSVFEKAFEDCIALKTVNMQDGLTYIGYCSFKNCSSIGEIKIPNSVQRVDASAFEGCSAAKSLSLSSGLKSLGDKAFYGCYALEGEIIIPNGVNNLGSEIFSGSSIISFVIPENVTFVSNQAFRQCFSLQSITCKNIASPYVDKEYFQEVGKNVILYVPFESIDLYRNANGWKWFTTILPIPGTEVVTYYTITFNNWDGTELQKLTNVEENTIPSYTGATPVHPNDDEYTYVFSGWSPEIVAAVADATYTATYVRSPIAEGIEDIHIDGTSPHKVIVDGVLYITMPDGRIYNTAGLEAK